MLVSPKPADPFLEAALDEALIGYGEGALPIGSVLVHEGRIPGRGHNRRVQDGNPILHAEMSCFMCGGPTLLFGVRGMVVGENRTIQAGDDWLRSHGVAVTLADDAACHELLQRFIAEQPQTWAEDIGEAGVHGRDGHGHAAPQ